MKNQKCRKSLLAALLLMLLLTGCVPQEKMSTREIVTAMEVLRQEEGYVVWVETMLPVGKDGKEAYRGREGRGKTFAQAVAAIQVKTGQALYFDSCKLLLVREKERGDRLKEILEEVDHYRGVRPLVMVALTQLPLENSEAEAEKSISEKLLPLLEADSCSQVNLKDCLNLLDTPGRGLLLPVVALGKEPELTGYGWVGATAMGWFPPELEEMIPFGRPGEEPERVRAAGVDGKTDWVLEGKRERVTVEIRNGLPFFTINVRVVGMLQGKETQEATRWEAQESIRRQAQAEYEAILEIGREPQGTDLLALGRQLSLKNPKAWQNYEKNWKETLEKCGWEVCVEVVLRYRKGT